MFEPTNWSQARLVTVPPSVLRLTICVLSFLLCAVLYAFGWYIPHSSIIWALPIGLSAWHFKRMGTGMCFFASLAFMLPFSNSQFWPINTAIPFIHNIIIIFVAGILLCYLRKTADVANEARQQVEQGEHALLIALEQQNKLNLLKQQFLVNINHELRTPLTAVYSCVEYLHMLLEHQGALTYKEHATYIQDALHSCEELRIMVNQTMAIMELECASKPLQTETVYVKTILTALLDQIPIFKQQRDRIRLHKVQSLTLTANATYLRHILYHLLSNALKYSPPDTPIVITCESCGNKQEQVCISIQDTGPGIPKEEIPCIFEDFVRLQRDVAGAIRGTGLGLSISKRLVEMMEGQIWVESTGVPGQGSCFCFILPRVRPLISIIT